MRILVYDDYTAGAEPEDRLAAAQVDVHRALVATLAVDLGRLERHDVRVAMPNDDSALQEDLNWADGALLMAPEANDRLTDLAERFEAAGVRLLGPSATAIRLVSDRLGLALALGEAHVPVPRSWAIPFARGDLLERIIGRLGFPLVSKPMTGSGGRGARQVRDAGELAAAVAAVRAVTNDDSWLLQEYLPGLGAGVGLAVAEQRARPLGLWGSVLAQPPALVVERCATPLDHPDVDRAIDIAIQAATAIPGLNGYVEVDLILSERGPVVLEIAARPTLGTLALRRSRQFNLAEIILNVCLDHRLPDTRFWPPALPVLVDIDDPAAALSAATFG